MPQAIADVMQQLTELPPLPKVTSKLLLMLDDDSVSVDELAGVVSADPVLVLKVIHLANSPFYMVARTVENLKDAIFILGQNTMKNITTGLSIQRGLSTIRPKTETFNMVDFWKHSYATAILASKLGARLNKRAGATLYLAGSIHDIGKLIIAYYWPDVWKAIVNIQKGTGESFLAVESRIFPHSHALIASELCKNWQFPSSIVDLVSGHHDFPDCTEAEAAEKAPLQFADHLVNLCSFSFPALPQGAAKEAVPEAYEGLVKSLEEEVQYQLRVLES
jgi:HD-like signal output (HDOD) protein